jgi:hypothetical protein
MGVDSDDDILTDGQTARIVAGYFRDRPQDKPFVICPGFSRPHMPWIPAGEGRGEGFCPASSIAPVMSSRGRGFSRGGAEGAEFWFGFCFIEMNLWSISSTKNYSCLLPPRSPRLRVSLLRFLGQLAERL